MASKNVLVRSEPSRWIVKHWFYILPAIHLITFLKAPTYDLVACKFCDQTYVKNQKYIKIIKRTRIMKKSSYWRAGYANNCWKSVQDNHIRTALHTFLKIQKRLDRRVRAIVISAGIICEEPHKQAAFVFGCVTFFQNKPGNLWGYLHRICGL